jgi:hypothetical protein
VQRTFYRLSLNHSDSPGNKYHRLCNIFYPSPGDRRVRYLQYMRDTEPPALLESRPLCPPLVACCSNLRRSSTVFRWSNPLSIALIILDDSPHSSCSRTTSNLPCPLFTNLPQGFNNDRACRMWPSATAQLTPTAPRPRSQACPLSYISELGP